MFMCTCKWQTNRLCCICIFGILKPILSCTHPTVYYASLTRLVDTNCKASLPIETTLVSRETFIILSAALKYTTMQGQSIFGPMKNPRTFVWDLINKLGSRSLVIWLQSSSQFQESQHYFLIINARHFKKRIPVSLPPITRCEVKNGHRGVHFSFFHSTLNSM